MTRMKILILFFLSNGIRVLCLFSIMISRRPWANKSYFHQEKNVVTLNHFDKYLFKKLWINFKSRNSYKVVFDFMISKRSEWKTSISLSEYSCNLRLAFNSSRKTKAFVLSKVGKRGYIRPWSASRTKELGFGKATQCSNHVALCKYQW